MVSIKSYTSISVSNSSLISRLSACSGVSPSSIFPPGNSHCPLNSPYPLAVANILRFSCTESQITATTTLIVFIYYLLLYFKFCFYYAIILTAYQFALYVFFKNIQGQKSYHSIFIMQFHFKRLR